MCKFNPKEFLAMSGEDQGRDMFRLRPDLQYKIDLNSTIYEAVLIQGTLTEIKSYLVDANLAFKMRNAFIEKHGEQTWVYWLHRLWKELGQDKGDFTIWVACRDAKYIIAAVLMAEEGAGG